ncbi:hypothetical protein FXO38_18078 [Capsicum annuum]|uniref:Uncharacterized protein n=1 Tax=Capsicum annuum TaxID=4072 RepID=A0A2G2YKQ3_CAPAN|nr:hypothetical protein FXO38_18078 [Capsicum annuum]KAF3651314.1 hypothetical protein FXO37_18060 [Capsicum annuum]PHT70323.1 hypothetical protein T459_25427 [Capsicum annuum]
MASNKRESPFLSSLVKRASCNKKRALTSKKRDVLRSKGFRAAAAPLILAFDLELDGVGACKNIKSTGSGTSSDNSKEGLDTSCVSGMAQLDLVSPNYFAVLEEPEEEEVKMPDLDTAEPKEIAQDECLGNKAEEGLFKERTPKESDLAHRSEDLEERVNYGSD